MKTVQLGIIGLGAIAQIAHLPALAALRDRFEIRHVCDLSAELVEAIGQRLPGRPECSTAAEAVLANPEIEAVMILTPGAHGRETMAALAAGKHVFAEKPLCLTVAEVDQIDVAARRLGRVVQVGYMKTHEPLVGVARAELATLKDPRLVRVTVIHPAESAQQAHLRLLRFSDVPAGALESARRYETEMTRLALGETSPAVGWLYRQVAQGSLVHQVSLVRTLVGAPGPLLSAAAWPFTPAHQPTEPPSLSVLAELPGDLKLRLDWLWLPSYPQYRERISVYAQTGRLVLDLPPPYRLDRRASLRVELNGHSRVEDGGDGGHRSAFQHQLEHFHAAVVAGFASDLVGVRSDVRFLQHLMAALAQAHGLEPEVEVE